MSGLYALVLLGVTLTGMFIGRGLHRCVICFPGSDRLRDQLRALKHQGDCPGCGRRFSGLQQWPVIGWLAAGRCRNCGRLMDRRRPVIELTTGLLLAWLYWTEIPDFRFLPESAGLFTPGDPPGPEVVTQMWSSAVWMHLRFAVHAVMLCGLIVATVIDLECCIIPDGCTIPAAAFAVLAGWGCGQTWIVPVWFQDPSTAALLRSALPERLQWLMTEWDAASFAADHPHWHGLLVSGAGMLAGAGMTWLVRAIGFAALKQEAMGDGDVVLMGMIGAALGWQPAVVVFMLASALAVVPAVSLHLMHRRSQEPGLFPYGPWLSLAAIILLLQWKWIWPAARVFFDWGIGLFFIGFVMFALLGVLLLLMSRVRNLLGLAGPDGPETCWTSADHLMYYGQERPDERTGQWPIAQWPGIRSGRGHLHYMAWKSVRSVADSVDSRCPGGPHSVGAGNRSGGRHGF